MTADIYQHYPASERNFIDKGLDWIRQVNDRQVFHCTYFLNPREREILSGLANAQDVLFFSEPLSAEYQKMIIAPAYYQLNPTDFDLALLEIHFPSKFGHISHRQILGALLGETGLDRREIGDVLVSEQQAQFFVSKHLVSHFLSEGMIRKIGGLAVKLKEIPLDKVITTEDEAVTSMLLVTSLRLDKLVAASLNISRYLASNMVQSGQVKVNYSVILRTDSLLSEGDLLSIRGYGRIKILRLHGFTKKGKMKVEISSFLSRKGR
ncbi:MAG: cell division protein [Streptococcaceae bacterium]|jgi:RNA-binding protein YlmH|nr:cell division protein [Streptococcaceae bacterium]